MEQNPAKKGSFDLIKTARDYIKQFLDEITDKKALILDKTTKRILSFCYTKSELWAFQVFLIEDIEQMSSEKSKKGLKTVLFISPTKDNIERIQLEIASEKYTETFICIFLTL